MQIREFATYLSILLTSAAGHLGVLGLLMYFKHPEQPPIQPQIIHVSIVHIPADQHNPLTSADSPPPTPPASEPMAERILNKRQLKAIAKQSRVKPKAASPQTTTSHKPELEPFQESPLDESVKADDILAVSANISNHQEIPADHIITLSNANLPTLAAYDLQVLSQIRAHQFYPKSARSRRIEGLVTLFIVITRDGELQEVTVRDSSGFELLDTAALEIIKDSAPFPPPSAFQLSVRRYLIPMIFRLTSANEE